MPTDDDERELVRETQERLDDWLYEARSEAYAECFGGEDPLLTDEQVADLDRIDSESSRGEGDGVWGTDRYGVVTTDVPGVVEPRVVCVYHPTIPDEAYHGERSLPESTRREYNDALWKYAERVAEALQDRLEEFLAERGFESEE